LYFQETASSIEPVAARKRKSTWGGARPGAGRKPVLENPRSVTFDVEEPDLEALKAISEDRGIPVAEAIRRAIRAYLRRYRRD
jgi:hypothetical protein